MVIDCDDHLLSISGGGIMGSGAREVASCPFIGLFLCCVVVTRASFFSALTFFELIRGRDIRKLITNSFDLIFVKD